MKKPMDAKCVCNKKDSKIKELEEKTEILLSALKQIEMMGNSTQTKEAIFASLILKSVSKP